MSTDTHIHPHGHINSEWIRRRRKKRLARNRASNLRTAASSTVLLLLLLYQGTGGSATCRWRVSVCAGDEKKEERKTKESSPVLTSWCDDGSIVQKKCPFFLFPRQRGQAYVFFWVFLFFSRVLLLSPSKDQVMHDDAASISFFFFFPDPFSLLPLLYAFLI